MSITEMTPDTTVGELVRERPARSRIFEQLKLDYCCGGKLPLAEACARRGLDVRQVMDHLADFDRRTEAENAAEIDADAMGLTELADHIVRTHHAYLKNELPRLGMMVRKVAAVHGDRHPWMVELSGVFSGFAAELESHMMKEEQILFPLIRQLAGASSGGSGRSGAPGAPMSVANPIRVMELEHDDAGAALQRMSELSGGYTPPADACNTFRAMLDGLARLQRDMHQHVHKENNVLFPRAIERESHLAALGTL